MPNVNSANQSVDTELPVGRRVFGACLAVVACNAVGVAGALFTSTDTEWYQGLQKPSFQPPGWLFGPVWTLLYTLMGIALYRLFEKRRSEGARLALGLFAGQLLLNAIWSPIFFGAQSIHVALAVIGTLVVALALTIRQAWKVDRLGGGLLLPYFAWVCFATILNGAIVTLN